MDDIIRMARKYGCVIAEDGPDSQCEVSFHADQIIAMVRAAQAAEREACARMVDHILKEGGGTYGSAIRARAQQPPATVADRLARHGIPMPEGDTK